MVVAVYTAPTPVVARSPIPEFNTGASDLLLGRGACTYSLAAGASVEHMHSSLAPAVEPPRPGFGQAAAEASSAAVPCSSGRSSGSISGARIAVASQPKLGRESPTDVASLQIATTATEVSDPATPQADSTSVSSGSGERQRHAPGTHSPTAASLTASESAADLQQAVAQAAAAQQQQLQRQSCVDIPSLVLRMKQRPLTGQVVAWGWDAAAAMSAVRRTMPAQVFSSLWPATEACAYKMMPQDVLEMLESWLTLMQQCPRQFRLSRVVVELLSTYAVPAAVKRMCERQLAQLASLARDIALHRSDADMMTSSPTHSRSSARDLMQPIFSLTVAEVAWRCNNPCRYVSPETISTVVTSAPVWSWRVVRHRDTQALASLKLATAAALEEIMPHSPRDLSPRAFGKLKTGYSGVLSSAGSTPTPSHRSGVMTAAVAVASTPRAAAAEAAAAGFSLDRSTTI